MSPTLRHALAHTGWLISGLALAVLWLATGGPASSTPIAAATSLLYMVGSAVGVGVAWTLAQAAIHTRLGSRPMLPDTASPAPTISARRALSLSAVVIVAVSCAELVRLWPLLELLADRSVAWAAWGAIESIWRGLGAVALIGVGLGFGAELAWSGLRDRLSGHSRPLLSDRQA